MRRLAIALSMSLVLGSPIPGQSVPDGIVAEGVPPVPPEWSRRIERYRYAVGYRFAGWFAGRREMLLTTGSAESQTTQVYCVVFPNSPWHRLTAIDERIAGIRPRPGRSQFLFASDRRGDEKDQLFLFDTPTSTVRPLTRDGARNLAPRWSRDGRRLAWSRNAPDRRGTTLWVADPSEPGSARRLLEADGIAVVRDWSPDDRRLAVVVARADGRAGVVLVDVETGDQEPLPPSLVLAELRWSADGRSLFGLQPSGPESHRLARFDLESKESKPLTGRMRWELDALELSDDGRIIAVVTNEEGLSKLHVLDAETGRERPGPRLSAGRITGLSFRADAQEVGFNLETARSPDRAYSFVIPSGQLVPWTHGAPGGLGYEPPEPELIHYPSFDGRSIPAFLYRPPAGFRGPRPVLIDIHGGPASQFRPGFLGPANFLTNELGLALIYPNVRGSSGYGRTYQSLDDGPRREDAVRDVGALLDWVATRPDLDASRVAVSGGSYGGFMVLAALIRYGDRLRAGIDVAGISDFLTFLEAQRELNRDWARAEFGDEREEGVRESLRELSPLGRAPRIKTPLLVAQGANDPRVPRREAEQIVAAVRKNGGPVWYVLARDEGHSFARRRNRDYLLDVQYLFLSRYLTGDR